MSDMKNDHAGSYFDDFLREQGIFEEVDAVATKRVIAWQLAEEMKKQGLTKMKMAQKMGTSRSSLDRLLNPSNDSLALQTTGGPGLGQAGKY
jgi:hypothetical protein